ncbi:MAG: acetyl-CoA C-acyltransferase, partial [Pseudomonadota bacterium]
MTEAVIVGAARTAVGKFGGMYTNVSAVDLGVTAAKATLERAGVDPSQVDEVILGNVLGAGLGQNVARQVQLGAGMPVESNAFTINKVCASGLKSVMLAAQAVKCGDSRI